MSYRLDIRPVRDDARLPSMSSSSRTLLPGSLPFRGCTDSHSNVGILAKAKLSTLINFSFGGDIVNEPVTKAGCKSIQYNILQKHMRRNT